ncbi:hypothetical protein DAPPUDRAFT_261817 [Daphnia pulex]|uniref:Uncharacterized protein n=1 Tax=Daphnia pulex TaxID=6669 RepID=E9HLQ7_DAPPU|nr:hypothetical protein DAPPUDRAFT_261817 [Daphnia pulex]|eukprot:EFX67336.1 hypothetical protein DAPPUDRAFT_261817 [Daphnia pulex]
MTHANYVHTLRLRRTLTAIRLVRGRGCNESFRAAVNRSYDESGQPTDGTNKKPMETLDEVSEVEVNEMMPPPRSPSDIGIPMLNNKNETPQGARASKRRTPTLPDSF